VADEQEGKEVRHKGGCSTRATVIVAVACLALLALMLIPALRVAREWSAVTDCKSNLMNLSKAVWLYAHENNDYCPSVVANNGRPTSADEASQSLAILYEISCIENRKTFRCAADKTADLTQFHLRTSSIPYAPPTRACTSYGYDPTHKNTDYYTVPMLSDSWCPGSAHSNHVSSSGQIKIVVAYIDLHIEVHKGPPFTFGYLLPDGSRDDPFTVNPALPIPSDPQAPRLDACIMGGVHDTRP
jgi:hypothetical protein